MSADFEEAVARFEDFLEKNEYPRQVVWVTSKDVLFRRDRWIIYLRTPVPAENEKVVRSVFSTGIRDGRGVLFQAFCSAGGMTFAYAWKPQDDRQAQQHLMPTGVKLSAAIGDSRRPAVIVKSRLVWWYLRWKYRKWQSHVRQYLEEA